MTHEVHDLSLNDVRICAAVRENHRYPNTRELFGITDTLYARFFISRRLHLRIYRSFPPEGIVRDGTMGRESWRAPSDGGFVRPLPSPGRISRIAAAPRFFPSRCTGFWRQTQGRGVCRASRRGSDRLVPPRRGSARLASVHFSQLADRALPRFWRPRCTIHYGVQPRSKRPSATRARAGVSPLRAVRFCFDRGHRGHNREQFTTTTITTTITTTTIILRIVVYYRLVTLLLLLRRRALAATRPVYAHYHAAAVCHEWVLLPLSSPSRNTTATTVTHGGTDLSRSRADNSAMASHLPTEASLRV